ncbi:hypothetical protein [Devosia sp.]|uniref:hypothetical protein n=1 Tax=Devosia sp. TaxID=1871048 RepID=UPI003A93B861
MAAKESQLERLKRLCAERRLPETGETTQDGAPALHVDGTCFVSLSAPEEMVLHCPVAQTELLIEVAPEIYWQNEEHRNGPGLLVRLDRISDEELALRLVDAWHFRAPEHLVESYKANRGDDA